MTAEQKSKASADVFEQATRNYEQWLKSGLKLQQESAKWVTSALGENVTADVQEKMKSWVEDAIPQTQKNMELWLKLVEQQTGAALDLMKKGASMSQPSTLQEAQKGMFTLWEASLGAMCETTQTLTQVGSKTMESWMDFGRRAGETSRSSKS